MPEKSESLLNAIMNRRCVREFSEKIVPEDKLALILNAVQRTPSSKNTQPWKLTLFQGKALEALRADFTDAFDKNCTPSPEFHCELIPYYRNRACALGEALFTHKGFNRKDIEKRRLHNRLNYQFFDAPQVFVLSVNKEAYHEGTLIDCGIFAATLMLAIEGIDCGSCPQMSVLGYPNLFRQHIPDSEKLLFLLALPFGYAKEGSLVNTFVSTREPIENWFTLLK